MIEKIFPEKNLRLINLSGVILNAEVDLINDLHTFQLLKKKYLTPDIRKFLKHHIIKKLCDVILDTSSHERCVIIFNKEEVNGCELFSYFKSEDVKKEIDKIIHSIENILPIRICYNKYSFNQTITFINENSGEGIELYRTLLFLSYSKNQYYTFANASRFSQNNDLTELRSFFTSPRRNKLMLV